jgi:hypothetical protein
VPYTFLVFTVREAGILPPLRISALVCELSLGLVISRVVPAREVLVLVVSDSAALTLYSDILAVRQ